MKKHRIYAFLLLSLLLSTTLISQAQEDTPLWATTFDQRRTLYVSPDGTGPGTIFEPMSLNTAVNSAEPGDLIWLSEGVYEGGMIMDNDGTPEQPVVYRSCPNEHVVLDGGIGQLSAYTWLWGFEITDLNALERDERERKTFAALVNVRNPGGRLINNILHDAQSSRNGIGGWDEGAEQVYYGNVVYDNGHDADWAQPPHGAYTQNNFAEDGFKYYVNNMFLDHADICGEKCYNFHGYTRGGVVTGFHIENNVFANGRFSLGGTNAWHSPSDNHVMRYNLFYDSEEIQLGFRKPWQGDFSHNYIGGESSVRVALWGAGETQFTPAGPSTITHNTFARRTASTAPEPDATKENNPTGNFMPYIKLTPRTSELDLGQAGLRAEDVIDYNTYSERFRAQYWVNDLATTIDDIDLWRQQTMSDGSLFDANSTVTGSPSENVVFVYPNEYEDGRAHVSVYNWAGAETSAVDLSGLFNNGDGFEVRDPKDFFGDPLLVGTYTGDPIELATPEEFNTYVVMPDWSESSRTCIAPKLPPNWVDLPNSVDEVAILAMSGLGLTIFGVALIRRFGSSPKNLRRG